MLTYKELLKLCEDSDKEEYLYHVTPTKNIKKIKESGIMPSIFQKGGKSNYVNGKGERYGDGSVYAHDNYASAIEHAAGVDWDNYKNVGSGKVSVIKIKKNNDWEKDPSEDMRNYRKAWVKQKSPKRIYTEDIVGHHPVVLKHTRAAAAGNTTEDHKDWQQI